MIISAASRSACFAAFAFRSARSTLPSRSQPTTTTVNPAIAALAGFVPCALDGIRQTSRCASPRASCQARIASSPAYSPCEPAFGCSETAANPVVAFSQSASRVIRWCSPRSAPPARKDACRRSRQTDRDHLGRGIQLHRARPQRDHAAVQRDVLVLQPLQVAQHLVLGVMLMEDGLLQE